MQSPRNTQKKQASTWRVVFCLAVQEKNMRKCLEFIAFKLSNHYVRICCSKCCISSPDDNSQFATICKCLFWHEKLGNSTYC